MSQANETSTSVAHPAQGQGGKITELYRDYCWLRTMLDQAETDDEVNAVTDQLATKISAIANIRSASVDDLRAKFAIFHIENDGDLTDHAAIETINSLTRDLDAWPAGPAAPGDCPLNPLIAAATALCPGEDQECLGNDSPAIASLAAAAAYRPATSLDGALFLLAIANERAQDLQENDHDADDQEEIATTIRAALYGVADVLRAAGAALPDNVASWFIGENCDPRCAAREG